jgi:hypothetical protein
VSLGNGLCECGIVVRYWPPKASGLEFGDAIALCPRWGGSGFAISYCAEARPILSPVPATCLAIGPCAIMPARGRGWPRAVLRPCCQEV